MNGVVYVSIFIILVPEIIYCQQFEGDSCTHKSTGSNGVCKLINKCKEATDELVKYQRYPQICGFQGTHPIVCCVSKQRQPGEISYQKCREYSNYTIEIIRDPTNIIGAPDIVRNECGHKVVTLIVGGEPVGRKEFPHMALIGFEKKNGDIEWLCGGTIISERYILTAGHCLHSKDYGPAKYVRIGITNIKSNSYYKQDIQIAQRIAYPNYKPNNSMYNDIALLKLEKAARMNSYSRPACLYSSRQIKSQKAIATGWGNTKYKGNSSDDLLKVTLDLVDQQSCHRTYNQISTKLKDGIVEETQLCAGSLDNEEKDTCQGDSGGPLQIYHINDDIKCMYDIIGVTSFGKFCGLNAGVYTRVSYYVKWIEDIVWPDTS